MVVHSYFVKFKEQTQTKNMKKKVYFNCLYFHIISKMHYLTYWKDGDYKHLKNETNNNLKGK